MKRNTIRFLTGSLGVIFIFCIVVFSVMMRHMHSTNEESIEKVCRLYMSEMSNQIQGHFRSVVDLRLDMEKAIIKRYPPEEVSVYGPELEEELTFAAQIRNYEFVALYSEEGEVDFVYGEPVEIINEEPFRQSLLAGQDKLVSGVTESGDVLLLFGINASYPMKDGGRSLAILVGMPVEYINYTVSLNSDETLVYSHIIRSDGSYVLNNGSNHGDNYFDFLLKDSYFEDKTPEQVVEELKKAVASGQSYSIVGDVGGVRRNVYFEPLEKTEWVLVTVMLQGRLDALVSNLGQHNQRDAIIACTLILVVLLGIFAMYFRMSMKQMQSLKEAQENALRASKAKSEFLSNMSHDIRTPMNAIVGMTSIAISNIDRPETVEECLKKVQLSSQHLLGLINDVLDMSRVESGKLTLSMREISLRSTFESIVNIITPQLKDKNQNFDIFIHDILTENVFCDDLRLNQVLINLLSNAVKFTPEGGNVYITLMQEASPKGEDYVRTHIRVKDSGIGMSEEFKSKIFEAFTRENTNHVNHTQGTGLGMAITKRIIDQMQGTIEVNSEQGKGTEFHVTLDLEKAKVEEQDMILPKKDLLVVDDDEQMCLTAVKNLKEIGVEAEYAQSGEAAIGMVKKRLEEHRDYQFVLLDWKMPVMDGIETARKMRQQIGDHVPILMISAYDWSDIEEEARSAGISGFISKPLFKSTLYHTLLQFTEEKDSEPAKPASTAKETLEGNGQRLLVAEDYEMNWEILETLLPQYGYEVEWAENGQICVDKFLASEPGYYSAVLMDLRMPVMNGFDATRNIRSADRPDAKLPIIAMTADAFSDDVQSCLDCGMNAHVAKPIDMKELLQVIKRFVS